MNDSPPVTYKVFLDGKDQVLTVEQLEQLIKDNHIKPDTRIYNNEKKSWINYEDYSRLFMVYESLRVKKDLPEASVTSTDASALLIECSSCKHSYSKRASKCPKCGNTGSASCTICKSVIPTSSGTCPECGDPDPFGNVSAPTAPSQRMTTSEIPAPASVNRKRTAPIQKRTDTSDELTASPEDRKKMNQFLRWAIIIGSFIGASAIVAIIQDIQVESYVQRTPSDSAFLAMIRVGFTLSVPFIAFYLTRRKKIAEQVYEKGDDGLKGSSRERVSTSAREPLEEKVNFISPTVTSTNTELPLPDKSKSDDETYRLDVEGIDQFLTIEEVAQLVKWRRVKPYTRIYDNEKKIWINYEDSRLSEIVGTITSAEKPQDNSYINGCVVVFGVLFFMIFALMALISLIAV
jgi:RNA polymerase subunit RPABC4/transcription elongation factor Spt4